MDDVSDCEELVSIVVVVVPEALSRAEATMAADMVFAESPSSLVA